MHQLLATAHVLSDDELLVAAHGLVGRERKLTATLIAHLAEMAARGLAQRQGYPSLFEYCRSVLGFSESEAWARVEAANASRRFPLILDLLLANELTMTSAARLARHLTAENHERVLRSARGRTKEQVLELIASLAPKPEPPVVLRAGPAPRATPVPVAGLSVSASAAVERPASVPLVQPVAPDRYRYHVTIGAETRELLAAARDLSSHGTVDDDALLKRALRLLVDDLARRKAALTEHPRRSRRRDPDSRHIAAEVRRVVWIRDGGRCAYVGPDGHRCQSRSRLEFHHVKPYEAGGQATADNIQLRCRAHNQYEARVHFARDREVGRQSVRTDCAVPVRVPGPARGRPLST